MPEEKLTVVATFKAKEGLEDEVRQALMALVAPTRSEPGCINYDLHQSADDPSTLMLYENWTSKKDLDEHLAMPYLKDILAKADKILVEPVKITFYQMISEPA
jgi:quinol monooxygenase YgiN